MNLQLGGLHHVSAITGNANQNVTFYTQVLGLRLVKKTVNQDDVSAYHLFYGDELGHAGTEVTFFDFPGAIPNRPGSGTIAAIALAVPTREAILRWEERFTKLGVLHTAIEERAGHLTLPFTDPEGQQLELVAVDDVPAEALPGRPWAESPIPTEDQIRGLYAVRIIAARREPTVRVLTETLGFRPAGTYSVPGDEVSHEVEIFVASSGDYSSGVHVEVRPGLPLGRAGAGGVHHVAFRTPNDEEHLAWRERVTKAGLHPTQQIDRFYFHSIYFREPGGVLYEIATDGPGFATDENPTHLGERLSLPPFLEPYRSEIEAGLRPIIPADLAEVSQV